jgi:aminomethyltransferase
MHSTVELRRTPLYSLQKKMGARLVDFHGWELPIQFTSILTEHQAVRSHCGLFDVSHMGQVSVQGPQSLDFLQEINSNDIRLAVPGKAVYSHILNERGGVVDDVIVGCLAPQRYMVVVNASTTDKDVAWFKRNTGRFDVQVEDRSADYCMLAVQGPQAAKVLAQLVAAAPALPHFGVVETELFGHSSIIGRTGYTGEDGFEIITSTQIASRLWDDLLAKGHSYGILPCGLGARDTLRLEAGYLLYGQDLDDEHTPLEANYAWVVKFDKGDFIGKKALAAQKSSGIRRKLTGIRLLQSGVPRAGSAVYWKREKIGELCSATFSPTLQKGIGTGYFSPVDIPIGEKVEIHIRGSRIPAEIAQVPFYKRQK